MKYDVHVHVLIITELHVPKELSLLNVPTCTRIQFKTKRKLIVDLAIALFSPSLAVPFSLHPFLLSRMHSVVWERNSLV